MHGLFARSGYTMSIQIAGSLIGQARKEGLREAAEVVDRFADQLMRRAEKAHQEDDFDYYEALEGQATLLTAAANRIRNRAKRGARRTPQESVEDNNG